MRSSKLIRKSCVLLVAAKSTNSEILIILYYLYLKKKKTILILTKLFCVQGAFIQNAKQIGPYLTATDTLKC